VKSRVAPLGNVILIALSSLPSICEALKPLTKSIALVSRAPSSVKLVSVLANASAGETRGDVDRVIGRRAHLAHQRKHIGKQPRVEQRRWIDLLRLAMGGRLVEHDAECGEKLNEDRHGNFVHRHGHD
jgi:hypothetical protein